MHTAISKMATPLPNPAETRWYIVLSLCNSSASLVILENSWLNVGHPVTSGHPRDAVVGAVVLHGGEGGQIGVGGATVVQGSDAAIVGHFVGGVSGQTQAVTVVPTVVWVGAVVQAGQTVVVAAVEHFSGSGVVGQGEGGAGGGQSHEAPADVSFRSSGKSNVSIA